MKAVRRLSRGTIRRPTVGLMISRLQDIGFAGTVWPGVASMAEERGANLICFVGGAMESRLEFEHMRNVGYDLIDPQNVDGVIVMSGSVGQYIGPERLARYLKRFRPLPVVSIGMELEGCSSVLVDNAEGMRGAIDHLMESHGLRRIAFLRGPETSPEAEQRYAAYREALNAHGLPFDQDLVADGDFLLGSGSAAVGLFMDRRKIRFQAIACANDTMAHGVIDAFRQRGIRVPDQVRIVGFDDLEDSRYIVPPMTTVRQPAREEGRKAVELLLDMLDGKSVPRRVVLPTELIVRRSCGCTSTRIEPFALDGEGAGGAKPPKPSAMRRKRILLAMEAIVRGASAGLDTGWAERLFSALTEPRRRNKPGEDFLNEWENLLRRVGTKGGDVMQWHGVLSALRRGSAPFLAGREPDAADRMWRTAELLIGETAQWVQANRRFQAGRQSQSFIVRISEPLMTAFDIERLTNAVDGVVSEVGVRDCYFSLYDFPADQTQKSPCEWSRLILARTGRGRVKLEPGGRRFPSRELVPKRLSAFRKPFAMVLEPIHFRDERQFGFVLFGPLRTEISLLRETLSRQLGTALQGAALLQERRAAEELLRAGEREERLFQERLRALLEISNTLSRAESVDDLCRQAVELGRSRLGFDRLGIWFHQPDAGTVTGSFGTGADGATVDERRMTISAQYAAGDILRQTHPVALVMNDVDLRDGEGRTVGRGTRVEAAMWDGEKTIGLIAADNLLRRRPMTERDCELLNLYASTVGYLCSRKRVEDRLRADEQRERSFQERLRTLLEVGNELSRAESTDELCRRAVELGLSRLKFDRMGIWFRNPGAKTFDGSFGTDIQGRVVDERENRIPEETSPLHIIHQPRPVALVEADAELRDGKGNPVGRGMRVDAAMWDGERTIGWISIDNLLRHAPISGQDTELINLYASTLGYLCTRRRAEDQLRADEQKERAFQERLRTLLEISNELSRAESEDELFRQSVELGRSRLGFDRLGIWLYSPDSETIVGSFGTGVDGETVDERGIRWATEDLQIDILKQTRPVALFEPDMDLNDGKGHTVGRGALAQAAMWNGEKVIGFVSADNLLRRQPITERDCELLNLFASTVGYLCSRKRAEDDLRRDEERERQFEERLRTLLEINNELSRVESVDDLCRRAVELGRSRLGFDRLAIWFYSPDPGVIRGSYGTDNDGGLTDERDIRIETDGLHMDILRQTRPIALLQADADLRDRHGTILGRGMLAHAAMWNGEKVIGFVSLDNLLRHRPITEYDCGLLNSFASGLGYLCSRIRAEESLRLDEERERQFEERLRVLLEVSNELSRAASRDELCRRAVELGRSRLGFDRLGIWFRSPEPGYIDGSFGTDDLGRIVDERQNHVSIEGLHVDILRQTSPVTNLWRDTDLRDGRGNILARGEQVQAAMWTGETVIGFVSADNLIRRQAFTERDRETLNLFASNLGYLCSRLQAEEALKEYSERLEEMVEERTRELRRAQENLVRQEKLAVLGQLAATVSHELRNPLATIRVSATDLDRRIRDKGLGAERPLDRIQRSISRCDNIISELLDYARMPDPNFQRVEVDDWLNRLLDEQTIPPGITLVREISSGMTLDIDPERFRRVIINLLDNARQAMQGAVSGGGERTLTVRASAEADAAVLEIADTGPGISPEVMPHLFEPLYSTKGFGVGLGLSVVKGIVEQHGGEIRIDSRLGEGARAVIRLPHNARKEQRT